MDAFAGSLSKDTSLAGGVSKHMGALATSFATDTSLGGLSKPMDALVKALGTDSGGTTPPSTPGMKALINSLNANVSGATIAAIPATLNAGRAFVVEICEPVSPTAPLAPKYDPIAKLLKLGLVIFP